MKKTWAIRKDSEAVSPVIATILMVAITVVLAAVLYVMVLGFGGTSSTPGITVTGKTSTTTGVGFKITFSAPTADVAWTDLTIQLSDGSNTVTWNTFTTADLTSASPPAVWHAPASKALGTINVLLNITDLAGNGKMSNGDYITLQTGAASPFLSSVQYTLTLLYEPTSGSMIAYNFNG